MPVSCAVIWSRPRWPLPIQEETWLCPPASRSSKYRLATVCRMKRIRAHRRQGGADRPPGRRRLSQCRGGFLRLAQVGAADGRRRRGDDAHRAPPRHDLLGADAQHEGLRGRAGRPRGRNRDLRRGQRGLLAEEHQLFDRRIHRPLRARGRSGARGIRVRGSISCALGCPTRARSRRKPWSMWRGATWPWAWTRSTWPTPSAWARRDACARSWTR